MKRRHPVFAASVAAGVLFAFASISTFTGLSLSGTAHAQMGTPAPSGPSAVQPPVRPVPPTQTVRPLDPVPSVRPAPVLPGQPPTQTGPVAPQQRGTPQITIPLNRPAAPVPAVPAPPPVQRSADEPRAETLTRCNALAGAQAQSECRRRAGVQYRAQ
ncbi:MAG: hypothetical protein H0W40_19510 [Methylibium sp.]|uniref:hypothetical protein n=1 Tax=Methylibium sp. TaxID=2067992 RepID=UPI0017C49AF3|nr:hypothetical protein [Methylibium sp.]MBA3599532.1 hypothetical protein [Methylibium sp.]